MVWVVFVCLLVCGFVLVGFFLLRGEQYSASVIQGSTNKDYSVLSGPCWIGFLLGHHSEHAIVGNSQDALYSLQGLENKVHCGRRNPAKEELNYCIFALLW